MKMLILLVLFNILVLFLNKQPYWGVDSVIIWLKILHYTHAKQQLCKVFCFLLKKKKKTIVAVSYFKEIHQGGII